MNIKTHLSYLIILIGLAFASCSNNTNKIEKEKISWKNQLTSQIQLLGHRNWIVVADAAYPLQSNPGITTILSADSHLSTIKEVDELIKQQRHIKSIMYLDKEIDFITDEDAPGIDAFRTKIENLTTAEVNKEIHEDIIRKLDEASKLFNVVIIKTNFNIPYTSVFFQLDCKYWNAEAEQKLRIKMNKNE